MNVIYCGVLKDMFGVMPEEVYLASGDRVGELLDLLKARQTPELAVWGSLAVAVNDEYAGLRTMLRDGDEVALLPPVSGGSFAD